MILAIFFLSFFTGVFFIYAIFNRMLSNHLLMQKRLAQMNTNQKMMGDRDLELQKPFFERVIIPLLRRISFFTSRITPVKKRSHLERKLTLAGSPLGLKPEEFVAVYYSIMGLGGIGGLIMAWTGGLTLGMIVLYAVAGIILGYLMVELSLRLQTKSRQEKISRGIPDCLDLLTVSVEAGLGFDAALNRVTQKMKGPIANEFSITMQEMKMGKPRRTALRDLANRTGVEELNTFVSAILQADQLGVSIGNVLRLQSGHQRMVRRQKVEEKAMKAPIKIIIPLVLFIFPTIFIVLLAPAIINIIEGL